MTLTTYVKVIGEGSPKQDIYLYFFKVPKLQLRKKKAKTYLVKI